MGEFGQGQAVLEGPGDLFQEAQRVLPLLRPRTPPEGPRPGLLLHPSPVELGPVPGHLFLAGVKFGSHAEEGVVGHAAEGGPARLLQ